MGASKRPGFLTEMSVRAAPARVAPGSSGTMTVVLRVRPGYHIYAHEPGDRFLTATRLDPAPVDGIAFGSVRWPRAKRLKGALVHEGDVRFSLPFSVARGARPGLRRITLNAFAQGCNATDCYPPARFSLTATVRIG